MLRQNGVLTLPLSTLIDNLMLEQGNMKRAHYLKYLVHAKWTWKDLLKSTIFSVVNKVVDVVDGRVTIPSGVERIIALSTVDRANNIVDLGYNPNINTLDLQVADSKCSCKCEGRDTLCAMMDAIVYRTEPIRVNGQDLFKKIWNRVDPCGALYEVVQTPVWDANIDSVVYIEKESLVCDVEVNEAGCLVKTPENQRRIMDHCGCYMVTPADRCATYSCGTSRGQWTFEAGDSNIIDVRNVSAARLIISCQVSECEDSEIMIPEFAVNAMEFGILHRQAALAPYSVVGIAQKTDARRAYRRERTDMMKYLNPINATEFKEIAGIIPTWG